MHEENVAGKVGLLCRAQGTFGLWIVFHFVLPLVCAVVFLWDPSFLNFFGDFAEVLVRFLPFLPAYFGAGWLWSPGVLAREGVFPDRLWLGLGSGSSFWRARGAGVTTSASSLSCCLNPKPNPKIDFFFGKLDNLRGFPYTKILNTKKIKFLHRVKGYQTYSTKVLDPGWIPYSVIEFPTTDWFSTIWYLIFRHSKKGSWG